MPFLSILNRLTLKLPVESVLSRPAEILSPSIYYKTNHKKKMKNYPKKNSETIGIRWKDKN
jgi:hypothetical protein